MLFTVPTFGELLRLGHRIFGNKKEAWSILMLSAFSLYLFNSCDLMLNKPVYLEINFFYADIELTS